MLEDYIPESAPDYFLGEAIGTTSANPQEYVDLITNPDVVTGTFSLASGSYYQPTDYATRSPVIAGKSIIDLIKWHDLPENHKYRRTAEHDPEDRRHIRLYNRIRGTLVHDILFDDTFEVSGVFDRVVEQLDDVPENVSYQSLHKTLAAYDGAPRVKPAAEEHLHDVPRPAIDEHIKMSTTTAVGTWDRLMSKLQLRRLDDEVITLGETDDGHGYGCKIDRLGYVETHQSPLPEGLYITELKVVDEWHPAHLMQAEAYRRSLVDDLGAEPFGLVVCLGSDSRDYTFVTSHDDEWDKEELWRLFEQKARWVYENDASPYPAALQYADPR